MSQNINQKERACERVSQKIGELHNHVTIIMDYTYLKIENKKRNETERRQSCSRKSYELGSGLNSKNKNVFLTRATAQFAHNHKKIKTNKKKNLNALGSMLAICIYPIHL